MLCELLPLRLLPSLLCAAIVYPMVGLRTDQPGPGGIPPASGPPCAAMFLVGLCLVNLAASTTTAMIGIVSRSSALALMAAVVVILYNMLFCGLLVNVPTLLKLPGALGSFAGFLPKLSFLHYFIETVLVNELHDKPISIKPHPPIKSDPVVVPGSEILQQLGYSTGEDLCWFLWPDVAPCQSVENLQVLTAWVLAALLLCYLLLRFCVTDPH